MNGLRLVLFPVNSDSGLSIHPQMPLFFFLGGRDVLSDFLLLPVRGILASAEDHEEIAA